MLPFMNSDGLQRQDKLGDLHGKVAFKASICGLGMEKRKHFPSLGCLFFKRRFKAQQFVCPFHSNQSMGSAFKVPTNFLRRYVY